MRKILHILIIFLVFLSMLPITACEKKCPDDDDPPTSTETTNDKNEDTGNTESGTFEDF